MNKIYVGIISGSGNTGKSTFCSYCSTAIEKISNYRCYLKELSSVSWPKMVARFAGWDGESKTEKDRKFLSDLNIALERWNDSPLQNVFNEIENYSKLGISYFMVNIREPWRIEKFKRACLKKDYEVFTVLVTNPNIAQITSNIADASVEGYQYDHYIENNGTLDDLSKKAFDLMKQYYVS